MRGIIIVLMAILGVIFPKFLVKAIKSTDKNDAGGGLLGSQITFGMLMLIIGIFLNSCIYRHSIHGYTFLYSQSHR